MLRGAKHAWVNRRLLEHPRLTRPPRRASRASQGVTLVTALQLNFSLQMRKVSHTRSGGLLTLKLHKLHYSTEPIQHLCSRCAQGVLKVCSSRGLVYGVGIEGAYGPAATLGEPGLSVQTHRHPGAYRRA